MIPFPDVVAKSPIVDQGGDGGLDFIHLQNAIGQESKVANAEPNQLESISASQRIITKSKFVEKGKDVKTKKRSQTSYPVLFPAISEVARNANKNPAENYYQRIELLLRKFVGWGFPTFQSRQ